MKSTLDELRRLPDGVFHCLGDDLLRRMDARFLHLRSHGVNYQAESIKGQPDSYVGNTADTCTIAICYTVQTKGWWTKVVEDVKEAAKTSSSLEEVIAIIPHDADRHGPKQPSVDWVRDARAAAAPASFRLIDGRELAQFLDNDHQDLRSEYLRIPYSRLSPSSIQTSAQIATQAAIDRIRHSGRFDPQRYCPRSDDEELYQLWQTTYGQHAGVHHRSIPGRLIALVNDSGLGKTSLVCSFANSLSSALPVLLIQARDLTLNTETALVETVIGRLQGVLEPDVREAEEVAIVTHLGRRTPLTLIVDGLDEAHDAAAMRATISHWLLSKLGERSILLVTSRPEFWRKCADTYWERWMPDTADRRTPMQVKTRGSIGDRPTYQGYRLPRRFSGAELENAWIQAGRSRAELYALGREIRSELQHPFTLRVYLDLDDDGSDVPSTRVELIDRWLSQRLVAEASPDELITQDPLREALLHVATKVSLTHGSCVSVDDLSDVPRFDAVHPPGPVVRRLIGANILETLPNRIDHVRFTIEALQDFCLAESEIAQIDKDARHVAMALSSDRFTDAYPRLARIGQSMPTGPTSEAFVHELSSNSSVMAAVVLSCAPSRHPPHLRAEIAEALGQDLSLRHRVRAAFATLLLGEMQCPEAVRVLDEFFLHTDRQSHLCAMASVAFTQAGYVPAAEFVYRWEWFGVSRGHEPYYFPRKLSLFRQAPSEFRAALARAAAGHLSNPSGSMEHVKAVCVLAHLGTKALIDHLSQRLEENGLLENYENQALLALGTSEAGALFESSVLLIGEQLDRVPEGPNNHQARYELWARAQFVGADLRFLITTSLEPFIAGLLEHPHEDVSWITRELVVRGRYVPLLYSTIVAGDRNTWHAARDGSRSAISVAMWRGWWEATDTLDVRRHLMCALPLHPSPEIEGILISCLDKPELQSQAIQHLGRYNATRAAPILLSLLRTLQNSDRNVVREVIVRALGDMRYAPAVPYLTELATGSDEDQRYFATESLGIIGTQDAEVALMRMCSEGDNDNAASALIGCGTKAAMSFVVSQARARKDGPAWLCRRLRRYQMSRGWRRGEYHTHISTDDLVDYLHSLFLFETESEKDWFFALQGIDSSGIRELLRGWADYYDNKRRHEHPKSQWEWALEHCARELADRGDCRAVPYVLNCRQEGRDSVYVSIAADALASLPRPDIARELRRRLGVADTKSAKVRLLALLGRFGDHTDAERLRGFAEDPDDSVANIAYESLLRVTDPLLVPSSWREM